MVVISILALIAIPRYFANVNKATRAQVQTNLKAILDVSRDYYAVYGAYPAYVADWPPIIVTIDGDVVSQIYNPTNSQWRYSQECKTNDYIIAWKEPGDTCNYAIICSSGSPASWQTCTP